MIPFPFKLSKSLRKFVRLEKARIRREVLDGKKQIELIAKMYEDLRALYQKKAKEPQKVVAAI